MTSNYSLYIFLSVQDKVDSIQFCHSGERYIHCLSLAGIGVFVQRISEISGGWTDENVKTFTFRFVSGSRDGTARIWKLHQRQQWRGILLNMSATLPGYGRTKVFYDGRMLSVFVIRICNFVLYFMERAKKGWKIALAKISRMWPCREGTCQLGVKSTQACFEDASLWIL